MKNLIYQVYTGNKFKLYNHCTDSVKRYAERIGADYIIQTIPELRIAPNPFMNERDGKAGGWKKHGYLPIFEKENVFNYFNKYDKCCVIDADIFIKNSAPDIFDNISPYDTVGSVYECDLPITNTYANKIYGYSMVLDKYNENENLAWEIKPNTGYEFFNSGVMLYDSKNMKKCLNGMTPKQFLNQIELEDFINGRGQLKFQTDQLTLNYWFKRNKIKVRHLDWKWNCLYGAVEKKAVDESYFVHFFLKDYLPEQGENVAEITKEYN